MMLNQKNTFHSLTAVLLMALGSLGVSSCPDDNTLLIDEKLDLTCSNRSGRTGKFDPSLPSSAEDSCQADIKARIRMASTAPELQTGIPAFIEDMKSEFEIPLYALSPEKRQSIREKSGIILEQSLHPSKFYHYTATQLKDLGDSTQFLEKNNGYGSYITVVKCVIPRFTYARSPQDSSVWQAKGECKEYSNLGVTIDIRVDPENDHRFYYTVAFNWYVSTTERIELSRNIEEQTIEF